MQEEVKNEISEAAVKLAEYVHNNKFEAILVSGGSNQLSRSLLTLAWQSRFKDEKMPKVYVFDQNTNFLLYKDSKSFYLRSKTIRDWIFATYPGLKKIKNHSLCYVDDFSMSGDKYSLLKKSFERLGFTSELGEGGVFVGIIDSEAVRELQTLSLQIQDQPSLHDVLNEIEVVAKKHRLQAIDSLKEIGKTIRLK